MRPVQLSLLLFEGFVFIVFDFISYFKMNETCCSCCYSSCLRLKMTIIFSLSSRGSTFYIDYKLSLHVLVFLRWQHTAKMYVCKHALQTHFSIWWIVLIFMWFIQWTAFNDKMYLILKFTWKIHIQFDWHLDTECDIYHTPHMQSHTNSNNISPILRVKYTNSIIYV